MPSRILTALLACLLLCLPCAASDSDPAWSPDGKTVVFMTDRDGDIEIYAASPDGTHLRRLTHSPGRDAHPAFSRDGKKIAFQSPRGDRQPQVYVMNADGSNQIRLTDMAGFSGVPDWSPDDRQILFQANLNPTLDPAHWQIFLMNSDGSNVRQLTHDAYQRPGAEVVARWEESPLLLRQDRSQPDLHDAARRFRLAACLWQFTG